MKKYQEQKEQEKQQLTSRQSVRHQCTHTHVSYSHARGAAAGDLVEVASGSALLPRRGVSLTEP